MRLDTTTRTLIVHKPRDFTALLCTHANATARDVRMRARAHTHTHTHTHTYLTGGSVSSFRGAHRPHLGALSVRGEKGHSSYF